MTDVDQAEDVVYGTKDGMALVMDVFTPRAPRVDAGVLLVVSGGWMSRLDLRRDPWSDPSDFSAVPRTLLDAGYVVFAVAHGSQPRYTAAEAASDLSRAVRFVRHNAARFRIDPGRLGVVGASSGGHLSLMTGLAPAPSDPTAADPIDRDSSAVQAVTAWCPVTDLQHFGGTDIDVLEGLPDRAAAFDPRSFSEQSQRLERDDAAHRPAWLQQNSPTHHANADSPPTLLIHGDADVRVPIQQSERMHECLQAAGGTSRLVVLPGQDHAWPPPGIGHSAMVEWFGRYLGPERG